MASVCVRAMRLQAAYQVRIDKDAMADAFGMDDAFANAFEAVPSLVGDPPKQGTWRRYWSIYVT